MLGNINYASFTLIIIIPVTDKICLIFHLNNDIVNCEKKSEKKNRKEENNGIIQNIQ